ncbi:MAG TPA: transglycosylase SLT domain-containing protein [Nocardioides sp.]|jgi:peptidoglycan DL-endopeptidase CwlO|uniref:transglycosylase SLT domain-containing protein n=1 Tax=Nocardioides sp. TaxID=35761 RepID=UPI002CD941A3|nr:transglycosylase SLT domain-containing protein [Nocardioides sp.]HTW13769.1 transglycosylase SLT domain-containing protein [Nocardioides sp.]
MSVSEITSRISQIQTQLALLSPATRTTSSSFSRSLAGASTSTSDTTSATYATPASGSTAVTGEDVVAEARKYLGVPYVWGGTSPDGMDCSGLVKLVYEKFGIELPRVSYQQAEAGRPVASMAEAQPGDLIAWDNSSRNNGVDHIAIYIGNGQMIEAPRTGLDVRIIDVPSTPDVIRRVLPEGGTAALGRATSGGAGGISPDVPYANLFTAAAERYGVQADLLAAVARQESGFDPKAVSHAGAQGLMQLMPATAKGLGVTDSFDPAQAVDGAARLLRDLLDRFGRTDLALAGYNAGPGAVMRYQGIPPYPETQNYVRSILAMVEGN